MSADLKHFGEVLKESGIHDYYASKFKTQEIITNMEILAALEFSIMLYKNNEISLHDVTYNFTDIKDDFVDKYSIWFIRKLKHYAKLEKFGIILDLSKTNTKSSLYNDYEIDTANAIRMIAYDTKPIKTMIHEAEVEKLDYETISIKLKHAISQMTRSIFEMAKNAEDKNNDGKVYGQTVFGTLYGLIMFEHEIFSEKEKNV